jgi:hypothetical protein
MGPTEFNLYSLPASCSHETQQHRHKHSLMQSGFVAPLRLIKDVNDMRRFESSPAAARFLSFIQVTIFYETFSILVPTTFHPQALNSSVRGVKLSDECFVSPFVKRLLDALSTVEEWVNEYPPSPQQMRYGNISFRAWHQRLMSSAAGEANEVFKELSCLCFLGRFVPALQKRRIVSLSTQNTALTNIICPAGLMKLVLPEAKHVSLEKKTIWQI